MGKSALPLLPALLILVFPDSLGPLALDRPIVVLRLLRRGEPGLIGFTSPLGKVTDLGSKTRLEVQVGAIRRSLPQGKREPVTDRVSWSVRTPSERPTYNLGLASTVVST
jgi:hypothetical protein